MTELKKHQQYIKKKNFPIQCSAKIFKLEEIEVLKKCGFWMEALSNGVLKPISEAQHQFIEVCQKKKKPKTVYESAWFKYMGRLAIEKQEGNNLKKEYRIVEDEFYSREDYYKLYPWKKRRR